MAGELELTTTYINSLQAVTDISYIFPSDQKTLTYSVEGGGTQGWTATIVWQTLVVDQISYDRAELPIFTNSKVIGYMEGGGSASEYTNGVISIPANMYVGKVLPASDRYVPVTVVNLSWVKDGEEYSRNIAYIQQWEPGIPIGDPRDDHRYEPVDPIASQLVLSAVERVIEGDNITFTAVSDIPIDLGADNPCTFYRVDGGTDIEIGEVFFDPATKTATLVFDTTGLAYGATEFYAEFGGRREYGRTRSNSLTIDILEGIPLLVDFEIFNPNKAVYVPGDSVSYTLGVVPDPFFAPSGIPVENPLDMKTIDGFPPNTSSTFFTGNFNDGVATGTFSVLASMVDTALAHTGTSWTITTSTQNTTTYTATLFVTNTETVQTNWGYQTLGQYARGSTSTTIQVGNTTTRTVIADPFPLVLTQDSTSTLQEESFTVTLATTSSPYFADISIIAIDQATGSTSTIFVGNNSGTSTFSTSVTTLTTGTYTLYASYPGDLGNNIYRANRASVSNTLTHVVRSGNELGAKFVFYTTASYDVLRVWASTSTTLTQTVSFVQGTTLGTSSWSRSTVEFLDPRQVVAKTSGTYKAASFANNFTSNTALGVGWATPNNDGNDDLTIVWPGYRGSPGPADSTYYNKSANYPSPKDVNKYRLFKYYDGTNYDLIEVTGTEVTAIADPIEFHDDTWTVEVYGSRQFNLNQPFINTNTTFYNYIESRFGYANMVKYLESLQTLDGQPFKLNDLVFNDRPITASPPGPVLPYPRFSSFYNQMIGTQWYLPGVDWDYGVYDYATVVPDSGVVLPPNWQNNPDYKSGVFEQYNRSRQFNSAYAPYFNNDVINYTLICKNVPDNTVFTYEQIGTITQSDLLYGSTTGTITIKDGFGFAEFIPYVTTSKTFKLRLRLQSTGQIVGLANYQNPFGVASDDPWNTAGVGYVMVNPDPNEDIPDTLPYTLSTSTVRRGQSFTVTVKYPDWVGGGEKILYIAESGLSRYPIGPQHTYFTRAVPTYLGPRPDGFTYQATFTFNLPQAGSGRFPGIAYNKLETRMQVFSLNFIPGFGNPNKIKGFRTNMVLKPLLSDEIPPAGPTQTVKQTFYDIYRTDVLGDSRGYNVVAINASTNTPRPIVSEEDPRRLYFMGANNKERYIDLVEYIGEVQWLKPIENAQQKAGTQPRSTVRVWLYRFTPTIPQANTLFRTTYEETSAMDLDPNNNWQPRPLPGYPGDYVTGDGGPYSNYYRDVNFIGAERSTQTWPRNQTGTNGWWYYNNYGVKTWVSANVNDPVENDKAAFYNDWYRTFTDPNANIYTKTVFTTTYDVITTDDLQSATLLLPAGTISTSTGLRATWPGTRYLAPEFGRFNPFNIGVSSAFTGVDLDAFQVIPGTTATITATIVTSTNPVDLVATIVSEPLNIAANTGTVTFFNADTLQIINTATVSNNSASIRIIANDITNLTSAPFVNIRSRYQQNSITAPVESDTVRLQAVRSPYNTANVFNTSSFSSTMIFDWDAAHPYNVRGNSITYINGQIQLVLPSVFSATTSGYATYRIQLYANTTIVQGSTPGTNLTGVYSYSQPLGMPSVRPVEGFNLRLQQYYRDVPVLINSQTPTPYTITLNQEPMWLTPEWWKGTRPGDPSYWPVSAPGIFPSISYVSDLSIYLNIQLLGPYQLPLGSRAYSTSTFSVGR